MIVLGVDTSGPYTSLGLIDGSNKKELNYRERPFAHSEMINVLFEILMKQTGLSPSSIDLIAVSVGPGYFTALRVGLSFAKALAFSLGIPLISVNTLDALARQAPDVDMPVIALVEAQKDFLYAAKYRKVKGETMREREPALLRLREVREEKALFVGSGAIKFRDELQRLPEPCPDFPSGLTVAASGLERFLSGERDDPVKLEPFYMKLPDIKKHGRP
ncbi:MAG: tRNA (adenosine(37)-N6)-threonylcarbamoyltransferase complex dimerization subunit type 1 TsaB [Candidatus Hydrothermota bacterium]|nr:MAG: tRNA (adenosine(37)-N6)-threonylcarbamoyltransferase complex dimerization subunit type 1 TsaB [Candidatus Hydrothermae bacterium]